MHDRSHERLWIWISGQINMGMLWISAIDCVIRNKKIGEGFFKKLKVSQTLIHEVFKSPWYVLDEKHVREQSKRFLE